jgi:hypothetical protein
MTIHVVFLALYVLGVGAVVWARATPHGGGLAFAACWPFVLVAILFLEISELACRIGRFFRAWAWRSK